jgi:hypothetical protein
MSTLDEGKPPFPVISSAALVVANLVPVGYVLFQGWGVYYVLVLFWLENVAVGAFNILRMLVCTNGLPFEKSTGELVKGEREGKIVQIVAKAFIIPFFTVHYGIFTAVHGMFVVGMGSSLFAGRDGMSSHLDFTELTVPILALVGSHTVSFVMNYLFDGEYRRTNLAVLFVRPYGRVVVLHVTIIFGAFGVVLTGQHIAAVLLLLAIKIGMDLSAHVRERKKLGGVPTADYAD